MEFTFKNEKYYTSARKIKTEGATINSTEFPNRYEEPQVQPFLPSCAGSIWAIQKDPHDKHQIKKTEKEETFEFFNSLSDHEETKESLLAHNSIKQEKIYDVTDSFAEYQQDPLSPHTNKHEDLLSADVNESLINKEWKYLPLEDTKYNIDIVEHKVECSIDTLNSSFTSLYDYSIQPDKSNGRDGTTNSGKQKSNTAEMDNKQCGNYEIYLKNETKQNIHKFDNLQCCKKISYTALHKEAENYKFSDVDQLKRHSETVDSAIDTHKCNQCEKKFHLVGSLSGHLKRVHNIIKNYECHECHKLFTQPYKLKWHTNRVHKDNKNYKCDKCHQLFAQLGNLKRHVKSIHERIKYECNECHSRFSEAINLKIHIDVIHKQIMNYECYECVKRFSCLKSLKRHIKSIHSGIRCSGTQDSKYYE